MNYVIALSDKTKFIICYKREDTISIIGISKLKEITAYVNSLTDDAIIREWRSYEDIENIIYDYEHND